MQRFSFVWGISFLLSKILKAIKSRGKNQWRLAALRYSRGEMPLSRLKVREK